MKVSVIITAYNHEKYLAQCLESILSQQGGLKIEVIFGDDASPDGTRAIAEDLQTRHPEVIHILPREQKLGITRNLQRCLLASTGRYIAICEGDDYWLDPYKLKKQSDFLEQHPDYSLCFSPFLIQYEETGIIELHSDPLYLQSDRLTTEDLIEHNYIGNFSCCMYRAAAIRRLPPKLFELFTVDWMFNMACAQIGPIGLLRDPMSVYRKHTAGAWSGQFVLETQKKLIEYIDQYNEFFNYKYDALFKQKQRQLAENLHRLQTEPTPEATDVPHLLEWNRSLVIRLADAERMVQSRVTQTTQDKNTRFGWLKRFLYKIRRR